MTGVQSALGQLIGHKNSASAQVISGSAWRMLGSVSVQLSGLIRLAFLSRFLSPADFGLMAIVMLVLSILDTFTTPGFDQALIQRQGDIDKFFPSVYLVSVLRGCFLAVAILASASYVAQFFDEEGSTIVIRVAAIIVFLRGLRNPAMVRSHREMRFRRLFFLDVGSSVVALTVAIILAPILQDVWVLLIATMTLETCIVIGSYIVSPWRPRFEVDLGLIADLYRFGRWVVFASVIVFMSLQIDNIVVGRILGTTSLGMYAMAFRISQLPTTQITNVVNTVVYPALSRLAKDPERFRNAYLRLVSILFVLNLFFATGLVVFAESIVRLMLGTRWIEIVPLLQILAIAGFVRSMVAIGGRALYAVGSPGWDSLVSGTRLVVLAVTLVPLAQWRGLEGVALAVLISAVLIVPVYLTVIWRVVKITPGEHVSFALGYYRRMFQGVRRMMP